MCENIMEYFVWAFHFFQLVLGLSHLNYYGKNYYYFSLLVQIFHMPQCPFHVRHLLFIQCYIGILFQLFAIFHISFTSHWIGWICISIDGATGDAFSFTILLMLFWSLSSGELFPYISFKVVSSSMMFWAFVWKVLLLLLLMFDGFSPSYYFPKDLDIHS